MDSPFIEKTAALSGGGHGIELSYVLNIIGVILIIYIVYYSYTTFHKCDDGEDIDNEDGKSYIEDQIEMLRSRQQKNMR
jgi:uncharacterized membrane protein